MPGIAVEFLGFLSVIFVFSMFYSSFLCNLQNYCDSTYNSKLNSHKQIEFINMREVNYIRKKINRSERRGREGRGGGGK